MSILLDLKQALLCRCPRCGKASIFNKFFVLKDSCESCGLLLSKNDVGDGVAVFLIFLLGILLVPLALVVDLLWQPSLLVHLLLWPILGVILVIGLLPPIKAYVMILIYRHRPDMWDDVS